MRAEVPTSEADRAPVLSAGLVAGVCLALGLGIARWTVGVRPPRAAGPSEIATEIEAGAPEPTEEPAEFEAPPAPSAELVAPPAEPADIAPPMPAEPTAEPAAEAVIVPAATSPTLASVSATSTLVRGRVAYLRCEGGASGAACARDRALDDAVWAAIETLPTCATGPLAPGQADLVVEISPEGREVRARDTFASDVVRLDGASVVGCLSHAITEDPVIVASTRQVILSFRFSLSPL